jgi:SAM-dependent methyltransferase
MPPASRAERSLSFGRIADTYARHRPAPPVAAAAWLVPPGARRALDLAAGTGALTGRLVDLVPDVVAVEPDPRMLGALLAHLPGTAAAAGVAEQVPLRSGSVDLVTVSSAWHWMDPARVVPDVARLLRPGGVLGVLWGGPDRRVPWVAEVLSAGRSGDAAGADPAGGARDPGGRPGRRVELPPGAPFGATEHRVFEGSATIDVGDLPALAATYSGVITLPDAERETALAEVAARAARHPDLADRRRVELPLRCVVWRATREGRR